ncbi:DMT family transporter [Actinoplanes oblitus]|uniref:DMT family transporter n=1 Tax=Actinoplanes oblitus TaxID=3040509 RepID=A0ABY8WL39_9ACTN|nr:DMT family transporter [Actinoplanes oblitus]WIM97572.1 DMT family transporter [Actinoplanes oblitus]
MGGLGWAAGLSVLSAAAYAAAAVAQERLAEHRHRGRSRWAAALLLTGTGVVLHVLALNFGTVAVVQALGTLTLLFALPIQVVRYHRRVSPAAWRDAALTVAGLALILSLSVQPAGPALLTEPAVRVLSAVTAGVVLLGALGAWRAGPRTRAVLLAGASGVAFGIASVLSKAVLAALTNGGPGRVSTVAGVMLVALAVTGYLLGQLSYRGAGLAAPLATVSVANPLVAAVAGVVMFGEGVRFGTAGLVTAAIAAVVMGLGVTGLARRSAGSPPDDPRLTAPAAAAQ